MEELRRYIDWTPFFRSWDLHGTYPNIFNDQAIGSAAKNLYKDANNLLDEIIKGNLLNARGVIGFWPANSDLDDIILFNDDKRNSKLAVFHTIRQQTSHSTDRPNYALADFIAPISEKKIISDYIGGFALTCGHGENELSERFRENSDDYNSIMTKALADRLAEAFAERMHERVRKEFWGYSPKEEFDNDDLIREKYVGIRPAHGYPAQPDHTEKGKLFEILEAEKNIEVSLTDSYSMSPGASISGLYFSSPESAYFGVGKISKDQVKDYAKKKIYDFIGMRKMVNANTKLQIKNNFIKILITLTFGMLLVSCGMPTTVITRGEATVVDKERIIMQGLALDTYYKRYEKLNNLTYPLLTKSTEFCGKRVTYDIGLKTISLNQIDKRFRKAAEEKLSITEKQKVLFTINNSPSDQAGIKSGDIISEINVANKKWKNDDIFQNNEKELF